MKLHQALLEELITLHDAILNTKAANNMTNELYFKTMTAMEMYCFELDNELSSTDVDVPLLNQIENYSSKLEELLEEPHLYMIEVKNKLYRELLLSIMILQKIMNDPELSPLKQK